MDPLLKEGDKIVEFYGETAPRLRLVAKAAEALDDLPRNEVVAVYEKTRRRILELEAAQLKFLKWIGFIERFLPPPHEHLYLRFKRQNAELELQSRIMEAILRKYIPCE